MEIFRADPASQEHRVFLIFIIADTTVPTQVGGEEGYPSSNSVEVQADCKTAVKYKAACKQICGPGT